MACCFLLVPPSREGSEIKSVERDLICNKKPKCDIKNVHKSSDSALAPEEPGLRPTHLHNEMEKHDFVHWVILDGHPKAYIWRKGADKDRLKRFVEWKAKLEGKLPLVTFSIRPDSVRFTRFSNKATSVEQTLHIYTDLKSESGKNRLAEIVSVFNSWMANPNARARVDGADYNQESLQGSGDQVSEIYEKFSNESLLQALCIMPRLVFVQGAPCCFVMKNPMEDSLLRPYANPELWAGNMKFAISIVYSPIGSDDVKLAFEGMSDGQKACLAEALAFCRSYTVVYKSMRSQTRTILPPFISKVE